MIRRKLWQAWIWYAHAAGISVIAIGIAVGIVLGFAHNAPVIEAVGPTTVRNPKLKPGGTLVYSGALKRNESCPGFSVVTFTMTETMGVPVMVSLRRALPPSELTFIYERTRYIELPDAVFPGKWDVLVAVESVCPTRQQTDTLAQFAIEVERS